MINNQTSQALNAIEHGNNFPYDAPDNWYVDETSKPPLAKDQAHMTARGVLADLLDRRGIKWELDKVDPETRIVIVSAIADIIREGMKPSITADNS